jgi:hypothetical protein
LDKVFFKDGSLRDIYVLDVDLTDWQKCLDWIRTSPWEIVYYNGEEVTVYEEIGVAHIFEEKENYRILISINLNGVVLIAIFIRKMK